MLSTLLNCFVGRLEPDTGTVDFDGVSLIGMKPHEINQVGVSRVFQTPEIFGDLNLLENVMLPAFARRDGAFRINAWTAVRKESQVRDIAMSLLEDVGLAGKPSAVASQLSRGDKRRLELAMCLVQKPKLLLLDEPTAGLAPVIVREIERTLEEIKILGMTTIIVEQNAVAALHLADRAIILDMGQVVFDGTAQEVLDNADLRQEYLAI